MKDLSDYLNLTSENPQEDKRYQFSVVLKQTLEQIQNKHVSDIPNLIDYMAPIFEFENNKIKTIDLNF